MQPDAGALLWDARRAAELILDFVGDRTWAGLPVRRHASIGAVEMLSRYGDSRLSGWNS
jgi:hypothetical protein